jgi:hypothetical protein
MEENAVDHRLVLVRDRRDLLGQRENNVKVLDGKEVGVTLVQPLRADQGLTFRAVPIAATVEGNAQVTAGVTLFDVSAESGRAATLDRAHDAMLPTAECARVVLAIAGPGLAKDVRQFEPGGAQRRPQK